MNWKKKSIFILSVIVCCIPLFLTFNRGINYFDEGFILEGARRMGIGELPYRDFHFIYTPLPIFLLSFMFRLFGSTIIVERILGLSISILGVIFLGLLTSKLTKNVLLTFFSLFLYALWGPTHINFLWPVMIVLPFVFICLFLLLESHFFLAGVVVGIVLLCKQNFGAALILSLFGYCMFVRTDGKRRLWLISMGFVSVLMPFLIYLLGTRSLIPFLADINTYTIQAIVIHGSFSVPFPTSSIFKWALYAFPGVLSLIIGLALLVQKKNKSLLVIPFTTGVVYLLGIFPTPDWTHLLPLIGMTGILFALLPSILGKKIQIFTYLCMGGLICFGIYSALFRNYYRWEASFLKQTHCFSSGRMKYICVDLKNYAVISQIVPIAAQASQNDSSIFTFYNDPIYYFLLQKNNPTRYIDFNLPVGEREEQNVIKKLQQENVNVIISRFPLTDSHSKILPTFIEKNYTQLHSVYEFTVWRRASY